MPGSALWLAVALAAEPGSATPDATGTGLALGVPVEVTWIGLGVGLHPELTWRPIQPEGAFQLRGATGFTVGPELVVVPVSLGFREMALPRRRVSFGPGLGVQLQGFFPNLHPPVARLDLYLELAAAVRVADAWHLTAQLSPEFGMVGGFGLGFATRVGVQRTFGPVARRGQSLPPG